MHKNDCLHKFFSGTSVTTDFHFGQTNRWKFECKYGGHVPQYSYFEDDEESIIAE